MGGGFASPSHIEAYLRFGHFPDIHENMHNTLRHIPLGNRRGLLDLGACTGLLGIWARTVLRFAPVVALDVSEHYASMFRSLLGDIAPITYIQKDLDFDTAEAGVYLRGLLENNNISTVAARRCLPEILGNPRLPGDMDGCMVRAQAFGQALRDGGVHYLVLEGRRHVKNPRHALHSIHQEIEAMRATWPTVVHRSGDCAILT